MEILRHVVILLWGRLIIKRAPNQAVIPESDSSAFCASSACVLRPAQVMRSCSDCRMAAASSSAASRCQLQSHGSGNHFQQAHIVIEVRLFQRVHWKVREL